MSAPVTPKPATVAICIPIRSDRDGRLLLSETANHVGDLVVREINELRRLKGLPPLA